MKLLKPSVRRRVVLVTLGTTLLFSQLAVAYEVATHGLLTNRAYANFLRDNPAILDALGVLRFRPDASPASGIFRETYYDLPAVIPRTHFDFEDNLIRRIGADPLSIEGWLMRGVIREDDLLLGGASDDPYRQFRVLNHFYDPVFNRSLTALGPNARAPDWATGTTDAFTQPNTEFLGRSNHYTIFDFKEALFRALTLKARNGSVFNDLDAGDAAARQATRQAYWATAFRILGDVLHLNQDMAQPQHTRNDPHPPLRGHESIYETYIESRALGTPMLVFRGLFFDKTIAAVVVPAPLNLGNYPVPPRSVMNQYSDFWSTTPRGLGGKGLADYSNNGFFSAGKNFGQGDYTRPPSDRAAYTITAETARNWAGNTIANAPPVWVFRNSVSDSLNPGLNAPAVPLTSFSVFDDFMLSAGPHPGYHLIRENYDAQADLLLPRAVAYSEGLLQYAFRGSMEISPPDEGVYAIVDHSIFHDTAALTGFKGFGTIRLRLKNTSPPAPNSSGAEAMTGGSLFGVLRFHRNVCYLDNLTGQPGAGSVDAFVCRSPTEDIVVSNVKDSASVGEAAQEVTFTFPQELPINATDVVLQVVYRGPLGNEADAVVVASRNLSEPTFFTIHNAFDFLGIGDSLYPRSVVNLRPDLLNQVDPQSCVDRSGSQPRLRSGCFEALPSTLAVSTNSTRPTTIGVNGLAARRFSRVALLIEPTGVLSTTVTDSLPVPGQSSWTIEPLIWEYDFEAPNTVVENISMVGSIRGIFGWRSLIYTWDAGFHPTTPPDEYLKSLNDLRPEESQPIPVEIDPTP